ncbi:MAG: hypothetical protein ABIX46_03855 [Burkholderiaceae bacterium]
MLRLTIEQLEAIEALALSRHAVGTGRMLAQAFPALTARLADRFGAFVEAALAQGRRLGFEHAVDLAGYAGLWCLWGAGFEDKPGFEWAHEILADPARSPTLKVHQLRHRSREELRRRGAELAAGSPAGAGMGAAEFDAAVVALDTGVGALAAAQAVFEPEARWQPVRACDLGSIDLRIVEPADRHEYRRNDSGWQRVAAASPALPDLAWSHVDAPPPAQALLGHPLRGGTATRINLKVQMHAVCDPRVHAEVVHVDGVNRIGWHGRDAARLSLPVYAAPPVPTAATIAAVLPVATQTLEVTSCGQRDAGAPFGDFQLAVQVQPATQWLMQVQHPAWLPMAWPNADALPPPAAQSRLEADGVARPPGPSQAAWAGLQAAVRAGLSRLFDVWSLSLDGAAPRLEAQVGALMGQGGLTWGWQRRDATTIAMRCEGLLDFVGCALDLALTGELVVGPARARLKVACQGRSELRATLSGDAEPATVLAGARAAWRYPLLVEIEPLAADGFATLSRATAATPADAAIVGECGLRPRPDGIGWEWHFGLRVEPLVLATTSSDPLVGVSQQSRALLPALTLVDWSAS